MPYRNTLNAKVFKKMGFQLNKEEVEAIVGCTPQAVERMLLHLQQQMARYGARQQAEPTPAPVGSKPYKPPPKPEPRAPTVPRAPGAARAKAASNATAGETDDAMQSLLAEKDAQLHEMAETVDILEVKIQKLEQLVRLKDSKIATLQAKLQQADSR